MIKPIPKPGPKPKRPRKALKRTAIKAPRLKFDSTKPTFCSDCRDKLRIVSAHRLKLPKTNPERKRERHMRDFDGGIEHDHFVRAKGCALWFTDDGLCDGPIQAAHVQPRSTGGRWYSTVGLCDAHHRYQEAHGAKVSDFLAAAAKRNVLENLKEKGAI